MNKASVQELRKNGTTNSNPTHPFVLRLYGLFRIKIAKSWFSVVRFRIGENLNCVVLWDLLSQLVRIKEKSVKKSTIV